jgi:hypothetical protein
MEKVIKAALAHHAKEPAERATAADDHGARATEKEAQRWERLASAAREELAHLLPRRPSLQSRADNQLR